MLDRTVAPDFSQNLKINLAPIQKISFGNNQSLFVLNNPNIDVFRLELVFEAGTYYGSKLGQSFFTAKMLLGGTSTLNASQLIKSFDKYGGFVNASQTQERLVISLHGLSKYFAEYLPFIKEILEDSILPPSEFDLHRNVSLQSYKVENEKTTFVSSSKFREVIFGNKHSFGKTMDEDEINKITLYDLKEFYKASILNQPFVAFIAGNISDKNVKDFESAFSNTNLKTQAHQKLVLPEFQMQQKVQLEKEGSVQSSIRLGKRLFNRNHPDFYKFLVMNTLLGGYFGSRLMKNIREEKGLTYGINSSLMPLSSLGYFVISTDVKKENLNLALDEIYQEIEIIKNTKIDDEELNTIKNYMAGSIIGSSNTVFEVMDKHKTMFFEKLPIDFYNSFIPNIMSVSADNIMEMAQKYLIDLSVVSVG